MGFIKAFTGALGGTFADQWKDFYKPEIDPNKPAVALHRAVLQNQNSGRGENGKGYNNIITNGSKIMVPEGTALVLMQDGGITGVITEAGGYIYSSTDPNSKTMFVGDGIIASTIKSSWEKFKFGGQPGVEQLAFYVNLKEMPVHFGTGSVIKWNDSYFESKVGAKIRGDFSLTIIDPIVFIKEFVNAGYLQSNSEQFDFNDPDNDQANKVVNEFVNNLSAGITRLSVDAKTNGQDTYDYISMNRVLFGQTMSEEVERTCQWRENRGFEISNVTVEMEYDEATEELLKEYQQDDKAFRQARRMGELYQNNPGMMMADAGAAMKNAASNEGGAMVGFAGLNFAGQATNNMFGAFGNMQQPAQNNNQQPAQDPTVKLLEMKKLLDAGAITQEEYDQVKKQVLGI